MKTWQKFSLGGLLMALTLGAVYLITRGNSGAELLKYVPNDAFLVGKINFDKFEAAAKDLKKINLKTLRKKMAEGENNDEGRILLRQMAIFMEDPAKTGLDLSLPAYFFAEKTERGEGVAFVFNLNSETLFDAYIKNTRMLGLETGTENGVHFVDQGEGVYVSWLDGVGMISSNRGDGKEYLDLVLHHTRPGSEGNNFTRSLKSNTKQVSVVIKLASALRVIDRGALNSLNDIINIENISLETDISFDQGSMELNSKAVSLNNEDLKPLDIGRKSKWTANALREASKDGKSPVYFMSTSLNIQKILKLVEKAAPDRYAELMRLPSMKNMEASLSGDLFMAQYNIPGNYELQVKAALGTRVDEESNRVLFNEVINYAPMLNFYINSENLTFEDNRIKFDTRPDLKNSSWTPGKELNYTRKDDPMFIYVDLVGMLSATEKVDKSLGRLHPVIFASGDMTSITYKIYAGDKKTNILTSLFETFMSEDDKVTAFEPHTIQ